MCNNIYQHKHGRQRVNRIEYTINKQILRLSTFIISTIMNENNNIHHSLLAEILSLPFSSTSSVPNLKIMSSSSLRSCSRAWIAPGGGLSGRGCVCAWCWGSALCSSASSLLLSCAWAAGAASLPTYHTRPALQPPTRGTAGEQTR